MGLIGYLLEYFRGTDGDAEVSDAKCDPGGGDTVTCRDYQPSGYDGQPLPGDYLLLVPGPEKGSYKVAGYIDPNNAGTTSGGEVRLCARDGNGAVTGSVMLKTDGTVHIGEDSAASLIARADKVDAELEKLKTAHNGHTHAGLLGGTGSAAALTSGPTESTAGTPPGYQYSLEPTGADKGWVT